MLRLIKNKVFILSVITIAILVVMGFSALPNSKVNYVSDVFSTILSPFQRFIDYSGVKINNFFAHFDDIDRLRAENEALKKKLDEYENKVENLSELEQKNKELKEALDIKDQYTNMKPVVANIIAKDMGNWFNIFTIDRGKKDGISNDYPVITSKGLVGRVMEADILSSKIISLIDEDFSVSARLSKTNDIMVVKGDAKLKDEGLCIMEYIPQDLDLSQGDKVETSGIGGIFPKGITIGRVLKVVQKTNELDRYAIIEPSVDFKRLEEVIVLNTNEAGGNNQ